MKRLRVLGFLALLVVLAPASPSVLQEIQWPQFRGYDVPYVPTPPEVVDEMLRLADIKEGDLLYDLGCGDGRIVIAAAKRFGIKAVGIDIDPVRIVESGDNAVKAGVTDKTASHIYEGAVRGHVIVGTVKPADAPKAAAVKWQAARDPQTAVPLDAGI